MSTAASPRRSEARAPGRRAVVVMGVSGCGKSTVALGLAEALGLRGVDADDLHAAQSIAMMRAGQALTQAQRGPWLDRVGACLADRQAAPAGVVVACSALQRAHRDQLRTACPGLRFVFLDGDAALIRQRLSRRHGHFMPAALLDSQLQTLERPGTDEADVHRIDIAAPAPQVLRQALAALQAAAH